MDIDYQVGEVELSYKSTVRKKRKIATSFDAYGMLLPTFREDTIGYKEYFKVVLLNQAQEVLGYTQISEGGITETSADVRIILQAALLTNATATESFGRNVPFSFQVVHYGCHRSIRRLGFGKFSNYVFHETFSHAPNMKHHFFFLYR